MRRGILSRMKALDDAHISRRCLQVDDIRLVFLCTLAGAVAIMVSTLLWQAILKAPAPAAPCHAYCDRITYYAFTRAEGPLPHDCRFFQQCGCAYQCSTPRAP
jgi:hypothetical protein